MKNGWRTLCAGTAILFASVAASAQQAHRWQIQIHAGAGDIARATTTPAAEAAYRAKLNEALAAGSAVLDRGGSSLDAVEAAIHVFEDANLFDCGRGAVFNSAGQIELDASIMDGATLGAGAVSAVQHTAHPISLARAVMEKSPYVMLTAAGADKFAAEIGMEPVPQSYFYTEKQWLALEKLLKSQGKPLPPRPAELEKAQPVAWLSSVEQHWFGTTGVVALDRKGNLAAGTSTGGLRGKHPGRVGDSPIPGAGTYASNQSCAVSGTGVGEYFIRLGVARQICNLVEYKGMTAQQAADEVIHKEVAGLKGEGGVIVLTPDGQMAWSYNTKGMFRARQVEGGKPLVAIFSDEQ